MSTNYIIQRSRSHPLPVLKLLHHETLRQRMRNETSSNEDVFYSRHVTGVHRIGNEFLAHRVEKRPRDVFSLEVR